MQTLIVYSDYDFAGVSTSVTALPYKHVCAWPDVGSCSSGSTLTVSVAFKSSSSRLGCFRRRPEGPRD